MSDLSEELRQAWAEIDRLRAFIKGIEWSGFEVLYYDGAGSHACPACSGLMPGEPDFGSDAPHGHVDNCALVAALAPPKRGTP